jgi:hypothetical protein
MPMSGFKQVLSRVESSGSGRSPTTERPIFRWLTLAYVVLGRAHAQFSVPNVSMRANFGYPDLVTPWRKAAIQALGLEFLGWRTAT